MITLAVAAMLGAVAAPSFTTMVQNARQVSVYNEFTQALRFTRSEATKRSIPVTMCARGSDTSCGTNWDNGWLVFTDSSVTAGTDLTLDATDTIIRVYSNSHPVGITAKAVIRPATVASQSMVQFSERGRSNWDSGTIVVCDDRKENYARAMAVSGTGMIRSIRSARGVAPLDAAGTAVTCP